MRSPEEHLKCWLHPVVFATWTVFLIYLLASRRYTAFLRPEFGLLLALAHFIAMGFMLAAMIRSKTTGMGVSGVLRALVLLIPILYSMVMPDTMLGNMAFKKRYVGPTNLSMARHDQSALPPQGLEKRSDSLSPAIENKSNEQDAPQERTILELFLNPKLYQGQRVVVTGMILRDEQLKPHFGGRNTAVYRFLINCCAADALPLAIAVDSDQAEAFVNDQWVQVNGIFELRQINGKPVPLVENAVLTPVETPSVPYLF
jgi:putative membrane protein